MSSASKVTATAAASVNSASSRVTAGGRASAMDRVDGLAGAFNGVNDPWRRTYGEASQDGFGQFSQNRRDDPQAQYTPLVLMAAASFPASEANPDAKASRPMFIADLQRGVGVYELNMKVCAGVFRNQGSLVNRYS